MDLWHELKQAITDQGIRVQERLDLLNRISKEGGMDNLQQELSGAERRLNEAAEQLREEVRGR